MQVTYVIGQPGSGKSTACKEAIKGYRREAIDGPFAIQSLIKDSQPFAATFGRDDVMFPGTDTLSMSVLPKAVEWLERAPLWCEFLLAEGDRLSTAKFFEAARPKLRVVLIDTPNDVAAERRSGRGSKQDPSWLKGRITKVDNLSSYVTHILDGSLPKAQVGAQLHEIAFT